MTTLSEWFYRISKGWLTLLLTFAMAAFMVWVLPDQSAKAEVYAQAAGSPDTSFFYLPERLFTMSETYGETGRQAYIRARFTFDLIFPIVYGSFLIATISWLLGRSTQAGNKLRLLNLIPVIGVGFDYLENITASLVIGLYPARVGWAAILASAFTPIKWIFVSTSFIALLVALIYWLIQRKQPPTKI